MKNLRQLIRRYRNQSSTKRVRQASNQHRRLNTEALERRELLAADMGISELASHNPWNQYDVNNDNAISARDALGVINYLGRGESEEMGSIGDRMFYDVNGDNEITAADALGVINAIGRGEGMETPLIELLITAREYDTDPGGASDGFDLDLIGPDSTVVDDGIETTRTVPDANQPIQVDVGQIFELEVSYEDLREFPNRLGAFQLITDIVASQQGFLQPVLFETQQLVVDQSLRDVPVDDRAGTSVTISIPSAPPGVTGGDLTYTAPWSDFSSNAPTEVRRALLAFGYAPSEYELTIPEGVDPDDIAFQIHWTDIKFADVNLPDISIEVNEVVGAADIPATETAFDPDDGSGGFNPDAIPFNLNTKSRSFDDNEPFYTANNDGGFDPATGFTAVKGIGGVPSQGGGIPQLLNELEYPAGPFDAYSLPVKIVQPVTGLQISVQPNADDGEQTEAILIYGEDDRVPITNDTVVIEGPSDVDMDTNGKATIIINAVDPNGNNAPVESDTISETYSEDDGVQSIDLLQFVTDADGDTLSVALGTITGDTSNAVTQNGTSINVATGAYGALDTGQSVSITVPFTVTDGNGGELMTSASITINGVTDVTNSAPVESDTISETYSEDDGVQSIDLLQFVTDADGDTLSVALGTITGDTSNAVTQNGTSINVATGAYGALDTGQSVSITVPFTVTDGNGGELMTSASITINGVTDVTNSAPVESDTISETYSEDDGVQSIDLLQFVTDADGDTLSVALGTITGDTSNAVTQNGTSINVATGAYGALDTGQSVSITVPFTVTDGNGGELMTSASITINGVTDVTNSPPVVSSEITATFSEDDASQAINLLQFASDADGDTLNVTDFTISDDPNNAVSRTGNTANINPSVYGDLNDGQSQTIELEYDIIDGNGGSVGQIATITINGVTDITNSDPTATALSRSFNEGAATATVDLLANANDVDGDTLSVTGLTRTGGNAVGIAAGTNSLSVDPSDYSFLLPGQSEVITYDYTVIDGNGGSVDTTATITINGAIDDAPSTGTVAAVTTPSNSGPITIDVLSVANPGGGETQDLSIVTASLSDPAAGTVSTNGVLTFTPAAGFEGMATINYTVGDGTSTDDGTVALNVVDFEPSTIGGYVFIDQIENMRDVISSGATPFRDGAKDSNEQGLGGVPIHLMGGGMDYTAITDVHGMYEFTGVAPGSYQVMYNKPSNVIYNGPSTMSVTIGAAGGVTMGDLDFPLIGLAPSATSSVDILARTYLNSNGSVAAISNNGREGAVVSLGSNGRSNFIMAGEGFDGVRFAEVRTIDGSDTDMALLSVLTDSGDVMSAMIPHERAIASPDGSTMRFFGGLDDFEFRRDDQGVSSYEDFQNAVDQILSDDE